MAKPGRKRRKDPVPPSQYQEGFQAGYDKGMSHGVHSYGKWLDGPTIVIPTYNQLHMLKQCIASIHAHTPLPYEIVIVDNASTDGTADYLRSQSLDLRYTLMDENLGFAGGVNHGLMMARGNYIVVLNNDVLVTPGWLDNMMRCLHSDERIAAVGPVTNYIGGDQQIEVPYTQVKDMINFAQEHNKPDPAKWHNTDRLVGFCLLFRRELLNEIGYLDEGYQVGNYEDDDWMIRIRLLGRKLCIAGDSFVHHFGSVSMKGLGSSLFQEVNDRNARFYELKWSNPHLLIQETLHRNAAEYEQMRLSSYRFYPDGRLITTNGGKLFVLRNGHKHPIVINKSLGLTISELVDQAVRLSRPELAAVPSGTELHISSLEELRQSYQEMETLGVPDGSIVTADLTDENQALFQLKDGHLRRFITAHAVQCWKINPSEIHVVSKERLYALPQGLPIVAPPMMRSHIL